MRGGLCARFRPCVLALKVGGKKLHELAEGESVEQPSRGVIKIYSIDILKVEASRVKMRVHCSKGDICSFAACHDIS
ncbi:MAG: hypothetical protein ACLTST_10940 [Lachnospiraceae bacterium]